MCLVRIDGCGHSLNEKSTNYELFSHYSTRALVTFVAAAILTTFLVWAGTHFCHSPTTVTCLALGSLVAVVAYVKAIADAYIATSAYLSEEAED